MTHPPQVLLFDYAEVLSRPRSEDAVRRLAATAELEVSALEERYWTHRPAHDVGLPALDYWSRVTGARFTGAGDPRLAALVHQDVESWLELDEPTVEVVTALAEAGHRLAMLSNAPRDLAEAVRGLPVAPLFSQLTFSADLGRAKPEPGAFHAVLERLGVSAEAVVFIDDRPANTAAATELGFATITYTDAGQLSEQLAALGVS